MLPLASALEDHHMSVLTRAFAICAVLAALMAVCYSQEGIAESYIDAGRLAYEKGHYSEASRLFTLALAESANVKNKDSAFHLTIDSLNGLEASLARDRKLDQAEVIARRLVNLIEKTNGENNRDFTVALNNLGLLLREQGKLDESERVHRRTLVIRERILDADSPDVATSLMNLGVIYFDQTRYSEAEALFKRSLNILSNLSAVQSTPESLLLMALCNQDIAAIYLNEHRNVPEASRLLKAVIKVRETFQGSEHPDLILPLADYARALRMLRQSRQAAEIEARVKRLESAQRKLRTPD
jgi:tetratricopeptide (TPR) repeat protein